MKTIPIYVLHLAEDQQRLNHINGYIKKAINRVKIFDAVNGSDEELVNQIFNDFNVICRRGGNGERGIWCSYLLFFKYIVDNNIKEALLLQDDVLLEENFCKKLPRVRAHLPNDYLIQRLGPGDTGLLITLRGAKAFLKKAKKIKYLNHPTDLWMNKHHLLNKPIQFSDDIPAIHMCFKLIPNRFNFESSRVKITKRKKKLVFGLGTGRCGTVSLSVILNTSKDSFIAHEGANTYRKNRPYSKLPWDKDLSLLHANLDKILNQNQSIVGDVAFYYLPYVEEIIKAYPYAKFICLKRQKIATVNSYMAKTKQRNHWQIRTSSSKWNRDSAWDPCFPKYNAKNKEEAISMYWDEYYTEAERLQKIYPDKFSIFYMNQLNSEEKLREIRNFIGIPSMDTKPKRAFNKGRKH